MGLSVSGPKQQMKLDLSHAAPVRLAAAAIAQYFDLTGDIRRHLDEGSPY